MTKELDINNIVNNRLTKGIESNVLLKAKRITNEQYTKIVKNDDVHQILNYCIQKSPHYLEHIVLTSLYSVTIAIYLDWAESMSYRHLAQGSILHQIGLSRIFEDSSLDNELHPEFSKDILNQYNFPEQIKLIAYQHRECVNKTGFPNQISGIKIFPLAKIVGLSSYFANLLIDECCTPLDALKIMMENKKIIYKFDPVCIRAIFKGLQV